jgi:RecA/RadA recombinase
MRQSGQWKVQSMVCSMIHAFSSLACSLLNSTQLCVSVQMKYGVTSESTGTAIYIDTEGSFVPVRLHNMAMAAENHYRNVGGNSLDNSAIEQILKNVTYFRCMNVAELIACLIQLKQFMTTEHNVKLIILDSLAHPIRSIIDGDHLTRHKYTVRIITMLQKLASEHQCAVSENCYNHVQSN